MEKKLIKLLVYKIIKLQLFNCIFTSPPDQMMVVRGGTGAVIVFFSIISSLNACV